MPQMAPMSWTLLFMFFTIMLIMINMLNYYLYYPKMSSSMETTKSPTQNKNWKW